SGGETAWRAPQEMAGGTVTGSTATGDYYHAPFSRPSQAVTQESVRIAADLSRFQVTGIDSVRFRLHRSASPQAILHRRHRAAGRSGGPAPDRSPPPFVLHIR